MNNVWVNILTECCARYQYILLDGVLILEQHLRGDWLIPTYKHEVTEACIKLKLRCDDSYRKGRLCLTDDTDITFYDALMQEFTVPTIPIIHSPIPTLTLNKVQVGLLQLALPINQHIIQPLLYMKLSRFPWMVQLHSRSTYQPDLPPSMEECINVISSIMPPDLHRIKMLIQAHTMTE